MKCRTKTAKQKKAPPKGEKIMAKRVFIIVLDSFGIGEMPDAARFGDVGSNTLGAIVKSPKYHTPTLQKLGLFNIEGVVCGRRAGAFGQFCAAGGGFQRKRHHDRPLGNRGRGKRKGAARVSGWFSG